MELARAGAVLVPGRLMLRLVAGIALLLGSGCALGRRPGGEALAPGAAVTVAFRPPRDSFALSCGAQLRVETQVQRVTGRVVSVRSDTVRLRVSALRRSDAEREQGVGRRCDVTVGLDSAATWTVLSRRPRMAELATGGIVLAFFLTLLIIGALAYSGPG